MQAEVLHLLQRSDSGRKCGWTSPATVVVELVLQVGTNKSTAVELSWSKLVRDVLKKDPETDMQVSIYSISAGVRQYSSMAVPARYTADARVGKRSLINTQVVHYCQVEQSTEARIPSVDRVPIMIGAFCNTTGDQSVVHMPTVRDGVRGIVAWQAFEEKQWSDPDLLECCRSYDRVEFELCKAAKDEKGLARLADEALDSSSLMFKGDTIVLSVHEEALSATTSANPGSIVFVFALELIGMLVAQPAPVVSADDLLSELSDRDV